MPQLFLMVGDITTLDVNFIVNAAKPSLLGGGGVDGAIHRAAGPELLKACKKIRPIQHPYEGLRCLTGQVRITPAYNLLAGEVIHTVGPVFAEHSQSRACFLLQECYRKSCVIAYTRMPANYGAIAFPCISTGVYGFPIMLATSIALLTCEMYGQGLDITFCCFSNDDAAIYEAVAATIGLTLERI